MCNCNILEPLHAGYINYDSSAVCVSLNVDNDSDKHSR